MEAKYPFAITLAHELAHILYHEQRPGYAEQRPNLSLASLTPEKNLDNREEQATITGLGKPISMKRRN